ncbi:unnamed protein product [Rotaria sp. Silwood1]|nr:unnamed protein product [Rotaria sp. Silwood1]CAF1476391.1 unnamed protein product [Rotaria sp. Silwood1]CAF1477962.1 unnamed protein product [Rotaria sp. Silwood1]CAF3594422.1 unnamed protein product [Rotaria sp. Silwood1]CAF3670514.1 unnamed protein product [Rotaria sp. Silwood1]
MMYCMLFVSLVLIKFNESYIIKATSPINQTCLNFGHANNCHFYKCFEERFPCGSSYWILKWGYKYCTRMQKSLSNFDKNGQELIEQISACLTNKLIKLHYYTMKHINCEQLRVAGQRMVHECYMSSSALFCKAFQGKNRDCLIELIDNEDRQDLTIVRTLISVGQTCRPKKRLADMRPSGKTNQCISSPML